jgi:hypothetical protein
VILLLRLGTAPGFGPFSRFRSWRPLPLPSDRKRPLGRAEQRGRRLDDGTLVRIWTHQRPALSRRGLSWRRCRYRLPIRALVRRVFARSAPMPPRRSRRAIWQKRKLINAAYPARLVACDNHLIVAYAEPARPRIDFTQLFHASPRRVLAQFPHKPDRGRCGLIVCISRGDDVVKIRSARYDVRHNACRRIEYISY